MGHERPHARKSTGSRRAGEGHRRPNPLSLHAPSTLHALSRVPLCDALVTPFKSRDVALAHLRICTLLARAGQTSPHLRAQVHKKGAQDGGDKDTQQAKGDPILQSVLPFGIRHGFYLLHGRHKGRGFPHKGSSEFLSAEPQHGVLHKGVWILFRFLFGFVLDVLGFANFTFSSSFSLFWCVPLCFL